MTDQLLYWVWLNSIPGVGSIKSNQLLSFFGSPKSVWDCSELDLKRAAFLNPQTIKLLLSDKFKDVAVKNFRAAKDQKIDIITIQDESYPYYLKNIHDPPIVLYTKGNIIKNERCIAIVGSRRATYYGLKMAESLSYALAGIGLTVISGMARGIDTYAHKGAISVKGRTIGVLGCGVDIVYPPENRELMGKAVENGAVISEFPPGTPPAPTNFPARNRIISGISIGVVVIEAGERSGSLITAEFALEQGREVFAVPGNINSVSSVGTNKLIKDGAKIVTGVEDILEELKNHISFEPNSIGKKSNTIDQALLKGLSKDERKIIECLAIEPLHIDLISNKSGFNINVVSSLLVMLELKGIVEQIPGKIFKVRE